MSFWDGVAALGLAGQGFDAADKRIRDRDFTERQRAQQEEVTRMALDEARRKDALGKEFRTVMENVGPRAAAAGLDVETYVGDDPLPRIDKGYEAPADANVAEKLKAASDFYASKGQFEQHEKTQKLLKSIEANGYKDLVTAMAGGRDPKEFVPRFNATGSEGRIVGAAFDGNAYRIHYEGKADPVVYNKDQMRGLASERGWLPKADLHNVPAGATVLKDGKPMYTSPPKPATELDPDMKAARLDLIEAQAEAARARANRGAGPGAGTRPRTSGNWNSFDSQVKSLAKDFVTTTDDSGRPVVDREALAKVAAAASRLARENPELSPAEAIEQVRERFMRERAILAQAMEQAEQEADGLGSRGTLWRPKTGLKDEAQRKEWIRSRANALAKLRGSSEPSPTSTPKASKSGTSAPVITLGTVSDGYRYKGGNPKDPKNWERE